MYIKDGIAYAGNPLPPLKVCGVCPLENYKLWVRFSDGATRIFDFSPRLESPAFTPLKDLDIFRSVYIEYGIPVWKGGEIDIAPEYLYKNGIPAGEAPYA